MSSKPQKIILFVGSPRKKGTSFSFARTFKKLFEYRGATSDIEFIIDYYDGKAAFSGLKTVLADIDAIGLFMPMYVDSLPAPVVWFLKKVTLDFQSELRGKSLFAVSQCGFPDVTLLQPSLESCRLFAQANTMKWLGGLGYGGGAIIDGALMEDLGKKGENLTASFRMAVEDITERKSIRPEVQKRITVRIPKIAYWPLAAFLNHRTRQAAKKVGVTKIKGKVLLE